MANPVAFSYSNLDFAIASRIAEVLGSDVTGNLVEQRIFRPLGMSNSTDWTHEALSRRYASGHVVWGKRVEITHRGHLVRSAAHGGAISDVCDQFR